MRAQLVRAALLFAVILTFPVVLAGEVVEFQDGRYLEVESHQVIDRAMRLNVAGDSYVVFPLVLVDRIERNGKEVFHRPEQVAERAPETRPADVLISDLRDDARPREIADTRTR